MENLFSDFNPNPIGVASLAQVHIAVDKLTGRKVAVKVMHPDLQEFTRLDMSTTCVFLSVSFIRIDLPCTDIWVSYMQFAHAQSRQVFLSNF